MVSHTAVLIDMCEFLIEQAFKRVEHPRKYFKKGRVFMVHWAEPSKEAKENKAYTNVERFVVIRPRSTHCICLPIKTYAGRATSKAGVNADDHAALVGCGDEAQLHSQERKLKRRAIAMKVEDASQTIDPMARINFGKLYTVEYNLPVRTVGRIQPDCLALLEQYFRESMGLDGGKSSPGRDDIS